MLGRLKWALVVLAWLSLIAVCYVLLELGDYGGGDFQYYYVAARDYLPAQMPYLTVVGAQPDTLDYPPLLPQLLIPLAHSVDLATAKRLWYALSVIVWVALVATLARYLPARQRFAFWLLAVLFAPVFEALRIGQVSVLLMALIGFAWVAVKEDRPGLAGFLLAAASWIKIYPALILVYFLWKRNWRAVWGGIVGGIGLALFQIAVSGLNVLVEFFQSLLILAGQSEQHLFWKNNSIYGFAAKLFLNSDRVEPLLVSPTLFTLTRYGLTALVLIALFALSARSPAQRGSLKHDERFDLEYALAVLTMLLVSPWMYPESTSPALITLFILWRQARGQRTSLLLLIVGLLMIANYLLIWQPGTAFNALLLSLGFYALALLWLINVARLAARVSLPPDASSIGLERI